MTGSAGAASAGAAAGKALANIFGKLGQQVAITATQRDGKVSAISGAGKSTAK